MPRAEFVESPRIRGTGENPENGQAKSPGEVIPGGFDRFGRGGLGRLRDRFRRFGFGFAESRFHVAGGSSALQSESLKPRDQ